MNLRSDIVDVVVPTVGRWDFIGATLDSIENQQLVSTRLIVVNDSGGAAPAEIEERAVVLDTAGHIGEGAARSLGLEQVESDYVAFCDDDDVWEPTKLKTQLDALNGADGWCLVGAVRVDEDDDVLESWDLQVMAEAQRRGELEWRLLTHNPIPAGPSSILVATDLLRRTGGWAPHMEYFADWACWIRLVGEIEPVLIDEPLVRYRVWSGQLVGDRRRGWEALDSVRRQSQERREALGVSPLDDRVIAWILRGELATPGRRLPGLIAATQRAKPRKASDLQALARYAKELLDRRDPGGGHWEGPLD